MIVAARGELPDRPFTAEFLRLRVAALDWIRGYYDREHLIRAADWIIALAPDASEALILAALTHDLERSVPGGPKLDFARTPWDDPDYNRAHCERSVEVVTGWLRAQRAPESLVAGVRQPIREHEFGGSAAGDLIQAADSISFLEVNGDLVASWILDRRCSVEKGKAKLSWMFERIRLERAREPARERYEGALALVDRRVTDAGRPLSRGR